MPLLPLGYHRAFTGHRWSASSARLAGSPILIPTVAWRSDKPAHTSHAPARDALNRNVLIPVGKVGKITHRLIRRNPEQHFYGGWVIFFFLPFSFSLREMYCILSLVLLLRTEAGLCNVVGRVLVFLHHFHSILAIVSNLFEICIFYRYRYSDGIYYCYCTW